MPRELQFYLKYEVSFGNYRKAVNTYKLRDLSKKLIDQTFFFLFSFIVLVIKNGNQAN